MPNAWCFSCGHIRHASRFHVATTSASRIMVAQPRLALSTDPAENKGRQLQTRVSQGAHSLSFSHPSGSPSEKLPPWLAPLARSTENGTQTSPNGDQAWPSIAWSVNRTWSNPSHDIRRVCQTMPVAPSLMKASPCHERTRSGGGLSSQTRSMVLSRTRASRLFGSTIHASPPARTSTCSRSGCLYNEVVGDDPPRKFATQVSPTPARNSTTTPSCPVLSQLSGNALATGPYGGRLGRILHSSNSEMLSNTLLLSISAEVVEYVV
jgi:hypothetical protein